jgi:hypothetical protein
VGRIDDAAGTSSTSSKVSASRISMEPILSPPGIPRLATHYTQRGADGKRREAAQAQGCNADGASFDGLRMRKSENGPTKGHKEKDLILSLSKDAL